MRILITSGPTREYFDTVRFISNASSGRMGHAIAETARARGHEVVLVTGPVEIAAPDAEVLAVTTADEMLAACVDAFEGCDAAVMAAAVSDWKPAQRLDHKAPKKAGESAVALLPTPDICATLGARKGSRVLIGFAMQDEDPQARAEAKLEAKKCDAMVLNHPDTLGSRMATVQVKVVGHPWSQPIRRAKPDVANMVVDIVEELVNARQREG